MNSWGFRTWGHGITRLKSFLGFYSKMYFWISEIFLYYRRAVILIAKAVIVFLWLFCSRILTSLSTRLAFRTSYPLVWLFTVSSWGDADALGLNSTAQVRRPIRAKALRAVKNRRDMRNSWNFSLLLYQRQPVTPVVSLLMALIRSSWSGVNAWLEPVC